jgi:hypothetical protein
LNILERLFFEPHGGVFREFFGLKTYFEPRDRAVYQRLLPEAFSMPDTPMVMIFVADYVKVHPFYVPRYLEAAVSLKCVWKGVEGWYIVTMPVTKWFPMQAGRHLGFPKYVADEISLARGGENWKAQVRHNGSPRLVLEYKPGITVPLTPWAKQHLEIETFFHDEIYLLVPPEVGPRAQTVRLIHTVPPKSEPVLGSVRIKVEKSQPWAVLVPEEVAAPGACSRFMGGINLVRKD